MNKILFIDRDGTLLIEPKDTFQIDSIEKLEFLPGVISNLSKIFNELEYKLVLITNQDGLGTKSFPTESFLAPQEMMLKTFESEGVFFEDIFIDKSFPEDNSETRKPKTGFLQKYIYGNYDMKNSYVIGDRTTDVELAQNLGCGKIFIGEDCKLKTDLTTQSWNEIYNYLKTVPRTANVNRVTNETKISISLNLDNEKNYNINTGIGFFDHMLEQFAKHAQIQLIVDCNGDLHVDKHHTIEDIAISIGEAFNQALGMKKSINRYGFVLPMDDCLAKIALDFGGRPWLEWDVDFKREYIGEVPTELFMHFFKSFSDSAKCNLNIKATGNIEHHKIEAIFKGFAKSVRMAIDKNSIYEVPSTKGIL